MEKLITPTHHSVSDWDFSAGISYILDNAFFVSPPSSLKLFGITAPAVLRLNLCRLPDTLNLPEGEVRSWTRYEHAMWPPRLFFRNQTALGSAVYSNTYFWVLQANVAYFARYFLGAYRVIGQFAISMNINTWEHWRCVWWNGTTPGHDEAIAVDLYKEVAGLWVQQGSTLYDTDNKWKDSAINRAGIGFTDRDNYDVWFDDTEIWGPV